MWFMIWYQEPYFFVVDHFFCHVHYECFSCHHGNNHHFRASVLHSYLLKACGGQFSTMKITSSCHYWWPSSWEWASRSSWGFYCGTKEDLVFGYSKGKIDWFLLFRLVFGTSMLYEVFERLMFGVSCLMFLSRFGSCGVYCAGFLGFFLPNKVRLMILILVWEVVVHFVQVFLVYVSFL